MTDVSSVDKEPSALLPSGSSDAATFRSGAALYDHIRANGLIYEALALAIVSRIVLFAVVWLGLRTIPRLPLSDDQVFDSLVPGHPFLDGWTRWDAVHYTRIAASGYPDGAGVAFFPVLPLLERAVVEAVGAAATTQNLAIAGIAVSNICFLAAVPILARLTAARFGAEAGRTAALLLCITPFGFFFSAAYTESLFVLLCVSSLALAQSGRWKWAALAAGLASGTRLFGLALTPALLLAAWRRGESLRTLAIIGLVGPAGTVAFFGFCAVALDDVLAPLHAQRGWGGWDYRVKGFGLLFLREPHQTFWGDPATLSIVLNVASAALVVATLPWVWRRLDPATALFTTLIAGQIVMAWVSLGRYVLPAVGAYAVVGALLARSGWRGWPRDAVVISCAVLQGVLALLFSHGYWIV